MAQSTKTKPSGLPTPSSTASFWHTEPSSLLKAHRTTRELPREADVVIVGSGITGASIAHHLLSEHDGVTKDKPNVVMLEAREACWGATGRNGGHCQPLFFEHPNDPEIGRFELANLTALEKLVKDNNIDCEWATQPSVRGVYDAELLLDIQLRLEEIKLFSPDIAKLTRITTDKKELKELRHPHAYGVVVTSIAARLWPYKLVASVLERLLLNDQHKKFNLQTLTPVKKLRREDDRLVVETDRGEIQTRSVVLATNGYTSHLLPEFADLIVPYQGQMSALIPPSSVSGKDRLKASYGFAAPGMQDYLIQRPSDRGEHLMFGGGRRAGEPVIGTWDDSFVDEKISDYLRTTLPKRFDLEDHELKAANIWTGILAYSRDAHPWVGHVPDETGLYLAAGYNGHGMPNAWLIGKAVALMWSDDHETCYDATTVVKRAQSATALPSSYLLNRSRMLVARQTDDVATQDVRNYGVLTDSVWHPASYHA